MQLVVAVAIFFTSLAIAWGNRTAVATILAATALEFAATVLRLWQPSRTTQALDVVSLLLLVIALSAVLGLVVYGPGRVTIHRILGAIAIYLNTAAAFAFAYRILAAGSAAAFGPRPFAPHGHPLANLVYFSLATLTTSGYGDVVPVEPFARSLANLEAVIGQLYPPTLLARLVTLELQSRTAE